MPRRIDLTGWVSGRLTVLHEAGKRDDGINRWVCVCECGEKTEVRTTSLSRRVTKSCGCLRRESTSRTGKKAIKHGMVGTPEYSSWASMKERCGYKRAVAYHRYGGRGIKVCDRWLESFSNFYEDMGKRPEGHQLDRIDANGDYEPDNCRWSTSRDNNRNRRTSKRWHIKGKKYESCVEAAESLGVLKMTVIHWCNGYKSRGFSYPPKEGCWSELKYG